MNNNQVLASNMASMNYQSSATTHKPHHPSPITHHPPLHPSLIILRSTHLLILPMFILHPRLILPNPLHHRRPLPIIQERCLERSIRQQNQNDNTPNGSDGPPDQEDVAPGRKGASEMSDAKGGDTREDLHHTSYTSVSNFLLLVRETPTYPSPALPTHIPIRRGCSIRLYHMANRSIVPRSH